jgi:hypothetical protein
MKPNLIHLSSIVNKLKKIGIKKIQFKFIQNNDLIENYKDFIPQYKKCAPVLEKIIEKNKDIKITLREFPICVFKKKYIKNFVSCLDPEKFLSRFPRIFPVAEILLPKIIFPNCRGCKYKSFCQGIKKDYAKYYGIKEFKPIR